MIQSPDKLNIIGFWLFISVILYVQNENIEGNREYHAKGDV